MHTMNFRHPLLSVQELGTGYGGGTLMLMIRGAKLSLVPQSCTPENSFGGSSRTAVVWQLRLSRDSTCTWCERHRLFTAPVSLGALKRCVYNLLEGQVPSETGHRSSRKKEHRQPLSMYPEVHLPHTSVPVQPPSADFPCYSDFACEQTLLPEEASQPFKAEIYAWHIANTNPQFYNQAALERLG